MAERIASYAEFWPHYLRAHRDPRTRAAHYLGTSAGLALLLLAATRRDWRVLLVAPMAGYAAAWIGHGAFEGNRPASFGHPFWSVVSDLRMLALWACGRLPSELERALRE
jgi:hypothetical protein